MQRKTFLNICKLFYRNMRCKQFVTNGLALIVFIIILVFICFVLGFFHHNFELKKRDRPLQGDENMDVYLRMSTVDPILLKLYDKILVQSMWYFWPDTLSAVVVLNKERWLDYMFGSVVQKTWPYPRTCFMENIPVSGYSTKERAQRDMFYPERCTSKTYVAYVETDTMFITRVLPNMLFADGKPIVVGIYGNIMHKWWGNVTKSTMNIFKTKEVMRCASYFPVVMKVEHLVKLRAYLENLHNMPFDRILIEKKVEDFSHFSLMCQYIWMFHRHEYTFYFQYQPYKIPLVPSTGREDRDYYGKLTPEQKHPYPRLSTHYKYRREDWQNQNVYRNLLRSSICYSGGFEVCPKVCKKYSKNSLRKDMFEFEFVDWTWDQRCISAQQKHYKKMASNISSQYREVIRNACNEVHKLKWEIKDIFYRFTCHKLNLFQSYTYSLLDHDPFI